MSDVECSEGEDCRENGLVVGLFTPLCALVLVVDMIVAVATNRIHSIQASGVLAWLDDFLYLPEVLYVMILIWLIFSGPGRFSLDELIVRWGSIRKSPTIR